MDIKTVCVDRNSQDAKDRFIPGVAGGGKGVDLAGRTIDGIASTIQIDRDGECILPSAMTPGMAKFLNSNAPFAAAHTHRAPDGSPTQIGWVMTAAIDKEKVAAKFLFSETNLANEWWKLASDPKGKGIAFSIGFIPVDYVYAPVRELCKAFPELAAPCKAAGLKEHEDLRVYTNIELLEISGCMAPSNRESLQRIVAKAFGDDLASAAPSEAVELLAQKLFVLRDKAQEDQLDKLTDAIATLADEMAQAREAKELQTADESDPSGCRSHGHGSGQGPKGAGGGSTPKAPDALQAAARSLQQLKQQ